MRPTYSRRILANPHNLIYAGIETRVGSEGYDWHGLKRGEDPNHPIVLIQHTLSGCGQYREGTRAPIRVDAEMAFCTIVPSDHRYWLPEGWAPWTFQWAMVRHPYAVARVIERRRSLPAVIPIGGDGGALPSRITRLIDAVRGALRDEIAVEQAIFEFERLALAILHPANEREALLAWVRNRITANLGRRCDVADLAAERSMSRSHFAHYFKAVTGLPPAQFITVVRLEEAIARLEDRQMTLDAIAAQTGFANANHFSKVFRRHFHTSPGQYRRMPMMGTD